MAASPARTITFAVSDVPPGTTALKTEKIKPSVERLINSPVEACHDYTADVLVQPGYHALIAAADFAYRHHFPLALSPDHIWLTIAQGFALHVRVNAEELRHKLVPHEGRAQISVHRDDFAMGSAENPWAEVFPAFTGAIREAIGDRAYKLIVSDFSTTGPVERAASEIVLLDTMRPYFEYDFGDLCGIPAVTLEGTTGDWVRILKRVRRMTDFGLDWWTGRLDWIIRQFIAAVQGRPRVEFWRRLYLKNEDDCGGPFLMGWLTGLLPYLQDQEEERRGMVPYRNPYILKPTKRFRMRGITKNILPSSCSRVPFVWRNGGVEHDYEFLGGLLAVEQDPTTLTVRPKVGWAVRSAAQAARKIRTDDDLWGYETWDEEDEEEDEDEEEE